MVPSQRITHFIGVIDQSSLQIFSKAIFRITKGNFTMQIENIEDEEKRRVCFLLIFPSVS